MNTILQKHDLARINRYALEPLKPDDIHTRSMLLCSNQLCTADWGRFSVRALERIAELLPGEAVLSGHDKTSLPIGRFYRAEVVARAGLDGSPQHWVRAWFYWLRGADSGDQLARQIDGGIYREVSVSWRFREAVCSICGGNIRTCGHTPGRAYDGRRCTFTVDNVVDVLEGSIVYRAADRNARFVNESRMVRMSPLDRQVAGLCRVLKDLSPRGETLRASGNWLTSTLDALGMRFAEVHETHHHSSSAPLLLEFSDVEEFSSIPSGTSRVSLIHRLDGGDPETHLDRMCKLLLHRDYSVETMLKDPHQPAAWCAVIARKED